jgi:hypothetical protein
MEGDIHDVFMAEFSLSFLSFFFKAVFCVVNDEDNCWHGCVVNDQIGERPTAPDLKKTKRKKKPTKREKARNKREKTNQINQQVCEIPPNLSPSNLTTRHLQRCWVISIMKAHVQRRRDGCFITKIQKETSWMTTINRINQKVTTPKIW